jgi:class 3 adenylate cyclase
MVDQLVAIVGLALDSIEDALPTGTVTFLLSDIEGSTELLARLGDDYGPLLLQQRAILRAVVSRRGGVVVDSRADELFASFPSAPAAVAAAIESQSELASHRWPQGATVRLRMGLHSGRPTVMDGGYVGIDVHVAARVSSAAHGGQVVLTDRVVEAVRRGAIEPVPMVDLGWYTLKGVPEPWHLYQVAAAGMNASFPPLRAERAAAAPSI